MLSEEGIYKKWGIKEWTWTAFTALLMAISFMCLGPVIAKWLPVGGSVYDGFKYPSVAFTTTIFLMAHELGHKWGYNQAKIATSLVIPLFIGACIVPKQRAGAWQSYVAVIRGPLTGIIAIPLAIFSKKVGWEHFAAIMATYIMINTIQCLPILPLDGGGAIASMITVFGADWSIFFYTLSYGTIFIGALAAMESNQPDLAKALGVILLVGILDMIISLIVSRKKELVGSEQMTKKQAVVAFFSYLGLLAVNVFGLWYSWSLFGFSL